MKKSQTRDGTKTGLQGTYMTGVGGWGPEVELVRKEKEEREAIKE